MTTGSSSSSGTKGTESFGAWAKTHHAELYIGLAGLVIAIALYERSKSKGATSTAGTVATGAPSSIVYLPQTGAGSGGEVGSPSFVPSTASAPAPAAGTATGAKAAPQGSPGFATGLPGNFVGVPTAADAAALTKAGTALYVNLPGMPGQYVAHKNAGPVMGQPGTGFYEEVPG